MKSGSHAERPMREITSDHALILAQHRSIIDFNNALLERLARARGLYIQVSPNESGQPPAPTPSPLGPSPGGRGAGIRRPRGSPRDWGCDPHFRCRSTMMPNA